MPTPSPPPAYADDLDAVARQLANLSFDNSPAPGPNPASVTSPQPPPAYSSAAGSVTAPLYAYVTLQQTGVTSSWSEASALTQGISGTSPYRLSSRSRAPRRSFGGYAVFCGLETGAFKHWLSETGPLVIGVSNSVYQGYATFALAQAAYEYAHSRGWTRVFVPAVPTTAAPLSGPLPVADWLFDSPNPLHGGGVRGNGRWYVVYRGITPGVYQSSLECNLNTRGLSRSCYDSWETKDVAIAHFLEELAAGRKCADYNIFLVLQSLALDACRCPRSQSIITRDSPPRASSSLMSTNQTPEATPVQTQYQVMMRKKEELRAKTRARMAEYSVRGSDSCPPSNRNRSRLARASLARGTGWREISPKIPPSVGANLSPRHHLQLRLLSEAGKKGRPYRNFFPEDYAARQSTTKSKAAPEQRRRPTTPT
ncbi:hypothetical protein B0H13DRAFT_2372254 [Mycena leptocephala]|nr:hypothetical protein B0H13DRAFT_2372254 [Mycena leptocephala]